MKILIIGIFSFLAWSALATYIYVCHIRGLCDEPAAVLVEEVIPGETAVNDTIQESQVSVKAEKPEDLVVHFEFDKSDFSANTESDSYFAESETYLSQNVTARLSITGHACSIGTREYNQALGYRRAKRMQDYFESKGMPADKIIIESKGEDEPVDDNNTKAGRAINRRAVITINE